MRDPQPVPAAPRLRGVAHQWAFVASNFTGVALVLGAPSARVRLARLSCPQAPGPVSAVFGYHEVFHVLVITAAALHYAAISFVVLPGAGE